MTGLQPAGARRGSGLGGRTVVITRPAQQGAHLAGLIENSGGRAVLFPVLEIRPPRDPQPARAAIDRLDQFDLAIFISPTAVERAMALAGGRLPPQLLLAAVGTGTARALRRQGFAESIAPAQGGGSEALLALPELQQLAGKNIVIFQGEGGRELLGETLQARGAQLQAAPCYRRVRPDIDPAPLLALWQRRALDAIAVTSSEGLRNLLEILGPGGRGWLDDTPLFVPHARIAEAGRALALERIVLTGPGDEGLAAGLVKWFDEIQYT